MIPRTFRRLLPPLLAALVATGALAAARPVLVVDAAARGTAVALEARALCLALRAESVAGALRVVSTIGCHRCHEVAA